MSTIKKDNLLYTDVTLNLAINNISAHTLSFRGIAYSAGLIVFSNQMLTILQLKHKCSYLLYLLDRVHSENHRLGCLVEVCCPQFPRRDIHCLWGQNAAMRILILEYNVLYYIIIQTIRFNYQ